MLRARDFRHEAWGKLSGRWGTLVVIYLIYDLIIGGCGALSVIGIGSIAMLIVTGPLALGLTMISLNVIRMNFVNIEQMFDGFKNFTNAFLLSLLQSVFVMLWSLLFIVPGIIKAYSYSMSTYILADNPGMAPNDAIKASMQLMQGNKWRLFCLDLSFIGWDLLSALTCGILYFWVAPYKQAAYAAFYQNLISGNYVPNNGNTYTAY